MVYVFAVTNLVLFVAWLLVARKLDRMVRHHCHRRWLFDPQPQIRRVAVDAVDPHLALDGAVAAPELELQLLGDGARVSGPSVAESWILAGLARQSRTMFEFGTCTGRTTYLWARNSAPEARITTLTLPPGQTDRYQSSPADCARDTAIAIHESRFDKFYYSDTDVAFKVHQLFGDSKAWDDSPFSAQFDLVFVDGSHAYSYVASDTAKALRIVRPGGVVLWHDYLGPCHTPGVFRFLNELSTQLPLQWIRGTSLVVYRRPHIRPLSRVQAA
jgi:hypothetical protein